MDDKTIRKNLQIGIVLLALCLTVAVAAVLMHWTEIAAGMGALAVMQAYFIYLWWQRKRHNKPRFQRKAHERK